MVKRAVAKLARAMAVLLLIAGIYMLAALAGSMIPANSDWQESPDGITLYVETNGYHTGLIVPRQTDVADFSDLVRPEHIRDPRRYGSHLLFGWGNGEFYRKTPTWDDFNLGVGTKATLGLGDSVLHVQHLTYPQAYPQQRRAFRVSEDEYRIIAEALRRHFRSENGQPLPPEYGYDDGDSFYPSIGRYNAFQTCNVWVASILRDAGLRVGIWPPFTGGVMRWFGDTPESHAR